MFKFESRRLAGLACACWLVIAASGWSAAQTPAPAAENPTAAPASAPPSPDPKKETEKPELDLSVEAPKRTTSFELTPAQLDRIKKYIPKTFAKLSARQPVHMVSLGDSVVDMYLYDDSAGDWLKGYPFAFAKQLADNFYYTGGVRIIRPNPGKQAKERPYMGPEITLRSLGRGGKLMIHAMQTLTTLALDGQPDLVTVSFGINDSETGLSLSTYAKALQDIIDTVRAQNAELILLSPTLTVADPPEVGMAKTRPFADIMREIARDNQVFFVDLGDLSSLVTISEDISEPADVFAEVVKQYRRYFNHGGQEDFIHPRPELHADLGRRIFDELTNVPKTAPWSVSPGTATLAGTDKFELGYHISNPGDKPLTLSVLPLVAREWNPQDAVPQIVLKPGKNKLLQVTYAKRPPTSAGEPDSIPSHEPLLRLPVLISGGGMTRIEEVRAEIRPLTLLWKLDTLFNQQNNFTLETLLLNTSDAPLKGGWVAEWMGQRKTGDYSLEPHGKLPLGLTFNLPSNSSAPFRQRSNITVTVTANGAEFPFQRQIEVSRNLGLKQPVPLTPASASQSSPDPKTAAGKPMVTLKADADKNSLYLTYEISGIAMEDNAAGQGAFGMEINLDARSYGKRLGFGATDALRINGSAADGMATIGNPLPWSFGTGYAAAFDRSYIKAQLSSGAAGARRITFTLPRSYLYLHEWALGNGNSEIGIGTSIMFWKGPREGAPQGDYPKDQFFTLLSNGRHRDDAEGLAVLELSDKPTQRWTVIPY